MIPIVDSCFYLQFDFVSNAVPTVECDKHCIALL